MKDFWEWLWHYDTPFIYQLLGVGLIALSLLTWVGVAIKLNSPHMVTALPVLAVWIIYKGYTGRNK